GFAGVWHLGETLADSSAYGNDGENGGTAPAAGVAGFGRQWHEGESNHVRVAHSASLAVAGDLTLSAWVKPWAFGGSLAQNLMAKAVNGAYRFRYGAAGTNPWLLLSDGVTNDGDTTPYGVVSAGYVFETGRWYQASVTWEQASGATRFYVNGAQVDVVKTLDEPGIQAATGDLYLGRDKANGGELLRGVMDEARIAACVRSAAWLWADYMTVAPNSAFTSYGPVLGPEPDRDLDGIPDDADPDDDNDGMSDEDEAVAGTDPLDPGSLFVVGATRSAADAFGLSFDSVTGRWYDILYNDDLRNTNGWRPLETNRPGTGGPIEVPDTLDATQRFYRVQVRTF
ncbi:MAG: LamG domain-containing protein, partial [Kiritimatiellae bacterium]|nr:LamG domain-containing protein [Kiritimatiellia bacterium]